jgi:hypothetical protein
VTYTLWRKGREAAVVVSHTDGTDAWMVEPETEAHYFPQFSADGQSVMFFADGGDAAHGAVKKVRLSDRTTQTANVTGLQGIAAAYSGNGDRFLANDLSGPEMTLNAVSLATGKTTRLAAKPGHDVGYGQYSPDEKWIAVDVQPPGNSFVGVLPASGGEPEVLLDRPGLAYPHGWAADNDRILFAGRYGGIWNVYWISRTSRHVEQLTRYQGVRTYVRYPSWSGDTTHLVFEFNESKGNIFVAGLQ